MWRFDTFWYSCILACLCPCFHFYDHVVVCFQPFGSSICYDIVPAHHFQKLFTRCCSQLCKQNRIMIYHGFSQGGVRYCIFSQPENKKDSLSISTFGSEPAAFGCASAGPASQAWNWHLQPVICHHSSSWATGLVGAAPVHCLVHHVWARSMVHVPLVGHQCTTTISVWPLLQLVISLWGFSFGFYTPINLGFVQHDIAVSWYLGKLGHFAAGIPIRPYNFRRSDMCY